MARTQKQIEGAQFVQWFGPLLDALRTLGGSGTPDEVVDKIALTLNIPDEKLNETLPSGELRFRNQVAWARFYLVREGLLDSSRRGVWMRAGPVHLNNSTRFPKWIPAVGFMPPWVEAAT